MTILNNELSLRLEDVEAEQNRLDDLLNELHELEGQISQLKTEMADKNHVTKSLDLTSNEPTMTPKLKTAPISSPPSLNLTKNETTITQKLKTTPIQNNASDTHGYVVCLMLNPQSPPEWSGKEWHIPGKGKCYSNPEQAHQCMLQLRKRWPGYPIQVLRR